MNKRIAIAVAITFALIVLGVFLQRSLLGATGPDAPIAAQGSSSNARADRAPSSTSQAERVVVSKVDGTVERKGSDGTWTLIPPGTLLRLDDVIRTGADSGAVLEMGASVTVHVSDRTEFIVAQVSKTVSRLQLEDGRLSSEVHGAEGFRLRVEVRGTDAVAESTEGRFVTFRRDQGPVTVAATEGSVRVSAKGTAVDVLSGQQSVVQPGGAPSTPTRIPPSLFLKVGPADTGKVREEARVSGETLPGAVVSINGVKVPVENSGEFASTVALREGENEIVVQVEDPLGRKANKALPKIRLEPKPPRVSGEVTW
jgi:hypothetical protein